MSLFGSSNELLVSAFDFSYLQLISCTDLSNNNHFSLEAVRCDSNENSRDHIPYCLSILANDGPTYGNLCRTFETCGAVLPSWVYLQWIPQLLSR